MVSRLGRVRRIKKRAASASAPRSTQPPTTLPAIIPVRALPLFPLAAVVDGASVGAEGEEVSEMRLPVWESVGVLEAGEVFGISVEAVNNKLNQSADRPERE